MKTMSDMPEIRGWCPGALRPMMSGDGLVVRVRPRGGRLSVAQTLGLADLSMRYGNGLIDLSARANLQVRGVAEAEHGALVDGLRAIGLIDPSTEVEARRNLVVTPFWQDGDGVQDLDAALSAALAKENAPQTPGKFGYAVDCGPVPILGQTSADVRIERAADGQVLVRADGCATGALTTAASAVAVALELAHWFLASGGAVGVRGRMAAHLVRGARLPEAFMAGPAQMMSARMPRPGPCQGGVLVGLEFGQITAETMSILAQSGPLRSTPWRMLVIEGATAAPPLPGLIATADDPLLRVVACTGAPGCPQAHAATRAVARRLAPQVPDGKILHVAGCAKGCAHPAAAHFTLVARAGGTFDLVRDGTAADPAAVTGLMPDDLSPALLRETR